MHKFKNLTVWQKSRELVVKIYSLTNSFPEEEKFGITSQLRRAVFSISNNIAEGSARGSNKYFVNFLDIAYASCVEVECILLISMDLNLLTQTEYENLEIEIVAIQKMIHSLKNTIKDQIVKQSSNQTIKQSNNQAIKQSSNQAIK